MDFGLLDQKLELRKVRVFLESFGPNLIVDISIDGCGYLDVSCVESLESNDVVELVKIFGKYVVCLRCLDRIM